MKRPLYFLAVIVALIKAIFSSTNVNAILDAMSDKPKKEIFKVFHYLNKKAYKIESEEGLKRYKIFKSNLNWIKAKNAELGKEVYGITKFMDLTYEEFSNTYLIKADLMQTKMSSMKANSNSFLGSTEKKTIDFDLMADLDENETQNTFENTTFSYIDWTPYLNRPKDQGNCGSCWSFAAIATIEGQYHTKFGRLYDFSEQYLIDCDNLDYGCEGGWPSNTFEWLSKNGVVEQSDSPYKDRKSACEKAILAPKEHKIVKSYDMYEKGYSNSSKWLELLSRGPIVVAMDASDYGFGFYRPAGNETWNPATCGEVNHAVVAVGYENVDGIEYLKVRNSWGENWGINGYFRVFANNSCGILDYAFLPEVVNGTAPNPNPDPDPIPEPDYIPENCVGLYEMCGFVGKNTTICASNSTLSMKVNAVKPSKELHDIDGIYVFNKPHCTGDVRKIYTEIDCLSKKKEKFNGKSIAFNRKNAPGCIYFYEETCFSGEPEIQICGSVRDLEKDRFEDIKSIDFGDEYDFFTFYEQPNFLGKAYSVSNKDLIFNINTNRELLTALKKARSVYFGVAKTPEQ